MTGRLAWRWGAAAVFLAVWWLPAPAVAATGPLPNPDLNRLVDLVCDLLPLPVLCDPAEPPAAPSTIPASSEPTTTVSAGPATSTPRRATSIPSSPVATTSDAAASGQAGTTVVPEATIRAGVLEREGGSGVSGREPGGREGGGEGAANQLGLADPSEIDLSLRSVVLATAASFFGLLLIGFPSELFNRTVRENYAEMRKIFPWMGRHLVPMRLEWQLAALVASSLVAGLLGSFQTIGNFSAGRAIRVALALGAGFLVTNAVNEIVSRIAAAELGMPKPVFRAYPGALPLVGLFVAISAAGGLSPAYVYGHIAGSTIEERRGSSLRSEAYQTVAASSVVLTLAVACFALRAILPPSLLADVLAGVAIVALNELVFTLVPATFLDGHAPFRYHKLLWAAIYVPVLIAFLLLILVPAAREGAGAPLGVTAVLFTLFGGLSVGIWAYFKRKARD